MARKPRIEVDGGLYHLITRGNARQDIFHSAGDHEKFLTLLEKQKARQNMGSNAQLRYATNLVEKEYDERNATQA